MDCAEPCAFTERAFAAEVVSGSTVGGVDVLEELTNRYVEVLAQSIDSVEIDTGSCLLIEQRDRVAVKPCVSGDIADLELALSHQAGHVALDHDTLRVEISLRMTKSP